MDPENEFSDSDASVEHDASVRKTKRRRLHGACDTCRRKKIKCNSAVMPNKVCSNCVSSKSECTHNIPRQKRKESQQEYIRALEERLHRMEQYLRMTPPDSNLNSHAGTSPESISETSPKSSTMRPTLYPDLPLPSLRTIPDVNIDQLNLQLDSNDASDTEDLVHVSLAEHLRHLSVDATENRFFGKASAFSFAQHATSVKNEYAGIPDANFARARRPLYWNSRPWESEYANSQETHYVFPEPDLITSLIAIYFEKVNILTPLLHRPTFQKAVATGQHFVDQGFGMVLLTVCAVASRYSHDPRVCLEDDESGLSSGWKYMSQIPLFRKSLIEHTTLYDLQYYALAVLYFLGTSVPQAAWTLLGLGLRLAQEQGVHRRRGNGYIPSPDEELQKRAFWSMVSSDRFMSSFLGRPCIIQEEDIDADYPIECDDEYWEVAEPSQAFKQPAGKPSLIAAFNQHLKLCEMVAFTLRTLYSTKKSKLLSGKIGVQWEERVVSELDSTMNKWRDSLPQHLQWDPTNPNTRFFNQSTTLYASFYYVQIQVHRPFLQKNCDLSLSSLAICTNAARSCSHVADSALKRGLVVYPNIFMAIFASATVLVINMWGSYQSKLTYDPAKEMADIQTCLNVLKEGEKRWHISGRLGDLLTQFSSFRDPPLSTFNSSISNKRQRDDDGGYNAGLPKRLIPSTPVSPTGIVPHVTKRTGADNYTSERSHLFAGSNWDWDLSNISFARMGYGQGPMSGSVEGQQQDSASKFRLSYEHFDTITSEQTLEAIYAGPSISDSNDNTMLMWMTAPTTFSPEEWDTYIANITNSS